MVCSIVKFINNSRDGPNEKINALKIPIQNRQTVSLIQNRHFVILIRRRTDYSEMLLQIFLKFFSTGSRSTIF